MTIVVCLCNSNIWSSLNKLYILFPDEDRVAVHFFLSVLAGAENLKIRVLAGTNLPKPGGAPELFLSL
jgi:hypothetical protein